MLKKVISSILLLAIVSVLSGLLSGCGPQEYKRTSSYEEKDRPVSQQTVVE